MKSLFCFVYIIKEQKNNEYSHVLDETTTGKDGKYASTHRWSGYGELKMRVVVEDPNGVYAADSAEVALTCTDEGRRA